MLPDAAAEEAEVPLAGLVPREQVEQVAPQRRLGGERRRELERPRIRWESGICEKSRLDVCRADLVEEGALEGGRRVRHVRMCGHAATPVDERTPRGNVDATVAAEAPVEPEDLRVPRGARPDRARGACEAGDDLDVVGADAAQHGRADLLVAPPKQRALPADDADDDRGRLLVDERQQLALAEIGSDETAGPDRIHAEQGLRQAEMAAITRRVVVPGPST